MKSKGGVPRRTLLGWLVATAGGVGLVGLYAVFSRGLGPLGSVPVRILRAVAIRREHPARDRRKRFRNIKPWQEKELAANLGPEPNVIHWPHPALFKLRFKVDDGNILKIQASDWRMKVSEAEYRFEKSHSSTILEHLALLKVQVLPGDTVPAFAGLKEAIEILDLALHLPENAENPARSRRLYELLARFISLENESEPSRALTSLQNLQNLSQALPWAVDQGRFEAWHRKTVDRQHGSVRKKLQKRVLAAHNLLGSVSSSGK